MTMKKNEKKLKDLCVYCLKKCPGEGYKASLFTFAISFKLKFK